MVVAFGRYLPPKFDIWPEKGNYLFADSSLSPARLSSPGTENSNYRPFPRVWWIYFASTKFKSVETVRTKDGGRLYRQYRYRAQLLCMKGDENQVGGVETKSRVQLTNFLETCTAYMESVR